MSLTVPSGFHCYEMLSACEQSIYLDQERSEPVNEREVDRRVVAEELTRLRRLGLPRIQVAHHVQGFCRRCETPRPIYFTLACGWQNRICSAAEEVETMRSVEYGLLASPMSVFLNLRSWTEL